MAHPKPALLIAGVRTGGTFLSTALSNHPQVFCARGEPSHHENIWRATVPDWRARVDLLFSQLHYEVSMFKLVTHQAFWPEGWEYFQGLVPKVKIIYLEREDVLEQAVSLAIHIARLHPPHTFEVLDLKEVFLEPEAVVETCRSILKRRETARTALSQTDLPVLRLTYEQITQGGEEVVYLPEDASYEICEFLDVTKLHLCSHMKKIHKASYSETISNWHAVLLAVGASDVAEVLHKRRRHK